MPGLKSEMPRRNPSDESSGIQPGGLPGNQAGGDWESYQPDAAVVERHLRGLEFPVSKKDLIQHIRWQKAPVELVQRLEQMDRQEFHTPTDVVTALDQRD